MDPLSKGRKLCVETDMKQQDYCVDRISNLPPELIGKILSLLPTKQAVATSVLSPRWKWFWTFITRLDFLDFSKDSLEPSFISFVCRVLVFRNPAALDSFSVSCWEKKDISHFRAWVSAALLYDVKELRLSINVGDAPHVLPFDIFSCKKLLNLKISGLFKIDVPATVCLPSIEVLSLSLVGFVDEDSLKRLLMGCPRLEELEVSCHQSRHVLPQELFSCRKLSKLKFRYCSLMNVPSLVSLPTLQALHLDDVAFPDDNSAKRLLCGCPSLQKLNMTGFHLKVLHVAAPILSNLTVSYWRGDGVSTELVLETPSLRYLKVECISADSCELNDLNQLVEADISGGIDFQRRYQVVTALIMGMSNVKTLRLCDVVMEVIIKSGCELPKFHNLTTLKLGLSNDDLGWALLPDLLEKSPFLEMLVFELGLPEYGQKVEDASMTATWQAPQKVPYCLIHHLKVIQVNHFEGGDIEEEEMIKYFIENRGSVKDLTIQYSSGSGELWDINVGEG